MFDFGPRKKILIIDDEPDIRSMVAMRLEANDYIIIKAADGKEALEKMKSDTPDLIILDVMMPEMDGFEFFKIIRDKPRESMIPIIVLTARGSMRATFEVLNAEKFVPKPFDADELLGAVEYLLSKKVLLLSDESFVAEKVKDAFEMRSYMTETVGTEEEFLQKARRIGFEVSIIHLSCLKSAPENFIPQLGSARNPKMRIMAFCDANVKGTEEGDTVEIDNLRLKWKDLGVTAFYDARISGPDFNRFAGKFL